MISGPSVLLLLEFSRELLEFVSSSSTELLDDFRSFFEELDNSSSSEELLETFLDELDEVFSSSFAELLDSTSSASEDDNATDSPSDTTGEESSEHPKNINAVARLIAAQPRTKRLFIYNPHYLVTLTKVTKKFRSLSGIFQFL